MFIVHSDPNYKFLGFIDKVNGGEILYVDIPGNTSVQRSLKQKMG